MIIYGEQFLFLSMGSIFVAYGTCMLGYEKLGKQIYVAGLGLAAIGCVVHAITPQIRYSPLAERWP